MLDIGRKGDIAPLVGITRVLDVITITGVVLCLVSVVIGGISERGEDIGG